MSKYDWSNVPKEVNWIATDYDGDVFGYGMKKTPNHDSQFMWYGKNSIKLELNPFKGNWKDSLEERPNEH